MPIIFFQDSSTGRRKNLTPNDPLYFQLQAQLQYDAMTQGGTVDPTVAKPQWKINTKNAGTGISGADGLHFTATVDSGSSSSSSQ